MLGSKCVHVTFYGLQWELTNGYLSQNGSVALLTSHNTLLVYDLLTNGTKLQLASELHCDERPLLWSACFTKAYYNRMEEIYVAVGTIMNEILVWRPFVTQGQVERRLIGHHVCSTTLRSENTLLLTTLYPHRVPFSSSNSLLSRLTTMTSV